MSWTKIDALVGFIELITFIMNGSGFNTFS
jgi:hypothetical protein